MYVFQLIELDVCKKTYVSLYMICSGGCRSVERSVSSITLRLHYTSVHACMYSYYSLKLDMLCGGSHRSVEQWHPLTVAVLQ
jgi:hypothetical protein